MRTFLGFMKAAAIGVGISAVVGALLGVFAGDFLMGALAGAMLSPPGIIFGGLVYRGCRCCLGEKISGIIPAAISGILAAALMWMYFLLDQALHPCDVIADEAISGWFALFITAIIPVFAIIYGSGVGQQCPLEDQ